MIPQDPPTPSTRLNYREVRSNLYLNPGQWYLISSDRATRNVSPKFKAIPGIKTRHHRNYKGLNDFFARYDEEFSPGICKKCGHEALVNRAGICKYHARDPKDMVLS